MWIRAVGQMPHKSACRFSGSHIRANIAKLNREFHGIGLGVGGGGGGGDRQIV